METSEIPEAVPLATNLQGSSQALPTNPHASDHQACDQELQTDPVINHEDATEDLPTNQERPATPVRRMIQGANSKVNTSRKFRL